VTADFAPYVTSARRYLWLAQRERTRTGDDGPAMAFYARRLEAVGTPIEHFGSLPGLSALLTFGVLAVEEVIGAGADELVSYGLSRTTAEAAITVLEEIATMPTFGSTSPRVGQLYDQDEITLLASAARTASTTTSGYEVGDRGELRLTLDVTVFTGTSLHVQIETCDTVDGTYRVVDAFVVVTATGSQRRSMGGLDRFVRARCTFAGTTATYSLTGEGV